MTAKLITDMTEDECIRELAALHPDDARSQGSRAQLTVLGSRAQAQLAKQLVKATGRLTRATWALVGVTGLLVLAAVGRAAQIGV